MKKAGENRPSTGQKLQGAMRPPDKSALENPLRDVRTDPICLAGLPWPDTAGVHGVQSQIVVAEMT
jgi:hypothetical protein